VGLAGVTADLTPYVPRLVIEWLADDPSAEWLEVDGTMAFVDISGFTAMSEKLAGEGKAGAEQVTEVMNATFEALLDVAYAYGGGLLKFGGDALLLFFDGKGHEARAARAAVELRKTLRALGRPRTTAGTVTLKMHVGLHSGSFQFFLVGSEHRELIVTGPSATETVRMEAAAQAGEIAVSSATATALPEAALGADREGGRLLASAPPAEEHRRALPPVDELPLDECVPRAIRDHVTSGLAEPEHRQAAVAFLRMSGVDELVASDGVEVAAQAVAQVVDAVQKAAAEHDVCFLESDVDADGARIVLVAGAPRVTENDVERLLRTVRAAVEAETRLPLAVGVSRGRVFAGEVGAPFRRTYTILGGTAALAARLMARAQPRRILAPVDLLEYSATQFSTVAVEPLALKGLARPVEAVEVGPIEAAPTTPQAAPESPMVGRQRELAVMTAALAPVRMGFGTVLEVVGEAGVGKTRLVQEFRASAEDLVRIGARCDEYESTTPYFVFRRMLRDLLGLELDGSAAENTEALKGLVEPIAADLVPWIPLIALPMDVEVEPTPEVNELQPAFRRARLHGAVETLLAALLPHPTLVLLEDVHWIDEASSELLRHLGATNTTRPWAICCTRRPGSDGFVAAAGTPPVAAMTILLEPLHDDEATELARTAAGGRLDDAELAAVVRRAGGNPLFLRELISSSGVERTEELPDTVDAVVGTRIDRLLPPDRALLRWASVLGVVFDSALIAEVLADDPAAAADSEAWDRLAEFVERDPYAAGGFRFRHALIRDAAYEGLAFRRRRELHLRVGNVIERRNEADLSDVTELLSLHFSLGKDDAKTWQYSLAAGDRAQEKFANIEAAEFYRRALAVARALRVSPGDQSRVWESLAEACMRAGRLAEAKNAFAQARAFASPADQPALMHKEGLLREEQGAYSEALRWYTRGEKALAAVDDATRRAQLRVDLTCARAQARFRQANYDDALTLAQRVIDAANSLGDLRNLAHAYYLSHVIHTLRGSPDRHAFRGLALPIYEELGDLAGQASVLNNLGIEAYYEGRWDEARDLYERSRALRERIGDVINVATTTNNVGEIESDQGRFAEAEQRFAEALRIADAAGQRFIAAVVRSNLGRVAARAGRFEEAEELFAEAEHVLKELGAAAFVLELQARQAEVAALRADVPHVAIRLAEDALDRAERSGATPAVRALLERVRAAAYTQRDARQEARQALERALEIARRDNVEYEAAHALRALAALERSTGNTDAADAADDAAREIFLRLGVDAKAVA
jgi:predicted ATPase/class 3 adenylate cyclase